MDEIYLYSVRKVALRLGRNRSYWIVTGGDFRYFITDDFGDLTEVEMPL